MHEDVRKNIIEYIRTAPLTEIERLSDEHVAVFLAECARRILELDELIEGQE